MKEPLEKQLEQAYQIFKMDHERLREKLMDSAIVPQQHEKQSDYEPEPEQTKVSKLKSSGLSLGEIIMDSKLFKIAAGIVIVSIVAIGLKVFTGTDSLTCVAFGDVLEQIRGKSYTFDITTISEGEVQGTSKGMILQPGMGRFDTSEFMGGMTSITDFRTGESIMIFHGLKNVINMKEYLESQGLPNQDAGPLTMLVNPIENLWNLQDGNEVSLGEKEIDGQSAIGFKIEEKHEDYLCDFVVWADSQTGMPIQVEIITSNPDDPSESMTELMDNFNLDVELDPELFKMQAPDGYTMAHQNTLEETVGQSESTPEADKIKLSIELWKSGEEEKAVVTLLSVDWTQPFKFSSDMYMFYMKERQWVQLKVADQQKVTQDMLDMSEQLRKLCFKIWEDTTKDIEQNNFETAEKNINATLSLGRLINDVPELAYTPKLTAHAIIQKSLAEMEKLYQTTGQKDKLEQIQKDMEEMQAEHDNFVEQITSQLGGQ